MRNTRECRGDELVQQDAHVIENELCAYNDGEGKPETSCALQSESNTCVLLACFRWWYILVRRKRMPGSFPWLSRYSGIALRTAVAEYGCCLQNLFGTEESIEAVTE